MAYCSIVVVIPKTEGYATHVLVLQAVKELLAGLLAGLRRYQTELIVLLNVVIVHIRGNVNGCHLGDQVI